MLFRWFSMSLEKNRNCDAVYFISGIITWHIERCTFLSMYTTIANILRWTIDVYIHNSEKIVLKNYDCEQHV